MTKNQGWSDDHVLRWVRRRTGAARAAFAERVQRLWSGYGEIRRIELEGADVPSVILKRVNPPAVASHRRGWNTERSHKRKLRSYAAELTFYRQFAASVTECRLPKLIDAEQEGEHLWLLLEDLDAAGYAERRSSASPRELDACLRFLANFHGAFLGSTPTGLWKHGSYWHLATRPDELERTVDAQLKRAAQALDARLNGGTYRTLVHGDAKIANFCFSASGDVAALD